MDETLKTILTYVIPTIIASLVASIPAILSAVKAKQTADEEIKIKQQQVENDQKAVNGTASKDIAQGYATLTKDLQSQIDTLKLARIEKDKEDQCRDEEIRKLKVGVRLLVRQVKKLDPNCIPAFSLEEAQTNG